VGWDGRIVSMKPLNLTGIRFGRLVVVKPSDKRTSAGGFIWICRCDCGNDAEVRRSNLRSGATQSCGCLHRELSSIRATSRGIPLPECSIDGCNNEAKEYNRTLCNKHAQRKRRYGDPLYITPEEVRCANSRTAQLKRISTIKSTTYRKLFGRHEHRFVGELIAGRPLKTDEHVHHKDENKHNNDPSNLQIMTKQEHLSHHARRARSKNA